MKFKVTLAIGEPKDDDLPPKFELIWWPIAHIVSFHIPHSQKVTFFYFGAMMP
eukprot:c54864_g1_i1 orf=3-158(-)